MKTILVATDFSERSDRALRRATLLARHHGARLQLLHVIDDDQPRRILEAERNEAESLLRKLSATASKMDGVPTDWLVELDAAHRGIAKAAEKIRPDMLVLGPYRRQLLREVFIGTTAERVIRSSLCPVLVANAVPSGPYVHILQTTDMSSASAAALKHFAAMGMGAGVRNSVLHVFQAPALRLVMSETLHAEDKAHYLEEERQSAAAELSGFLSSAGILTPAPVLRPERAAAALEILKAAEEEAADLVVISTRGRSGLQKLVLGSVAEQVLRSSPIDILAIPPL
ncbi:MAG: universal stress protein [Alphaproteobacteria bacterium HGW-Alphaproteobacteria-18]|nr:MAG: universal stress protein [Alphaproteobacteria bacterium HGW-Alphaproteobacteria-18]